MDGHVDSYEKLRRLRIPDDMEGASVIDVGTCLGFFLHEFRKRNAGKLVGIESNKYNYDLAVEIEENILQSNIEFRNLLYPEEDDKLGDETFDYGLLMAVLHHMSHPYRVIEKLSKRITNVLICEVIVSGKLGKHKFVLRPKYKDIVPTERCMEFILGSFFRKVEKVGRSVSPGDDSKRIIYKAYK
ncbi:MAG: hypothetical protein Kow0099_15060 [Candidatus Abyssubacteria bacterium]